MSQAEVLEELDLRTPVTPVPVSRLGVGSPHRSGGLCQEQVERLVGLGGSWPPILVDRDHRVIDGAHRVAAARRLGLARIEAEVFDGDPEQAFVEFVRRNVAHGLMLTLAERKQAAARVLAVHPVWSDRRIAELCALSPKTVARLRCPSEEGRQSDGGMREGRDHRLRPARPGSARDRVLEALRDHPDASLRTVASAAGVSPETVRLVRLNLAQAPDPRPDDEPEWRDDVALHSSADGEDLMAWFERTAVDEADLARVDAVPLGRVYVVADEARRRSETWLQLARALEARPGRSR